MAHSFAVKNLKHYKDIAWLLVKYGRSDWARGMGLDVEEATRATDTDASAMRAEELTRDLEELGPTYIKLGQLLSTRSDLLPPSVLAALSRLQDKVEPFSFADVERVVEQELGVRISKAFAEFESTPIAAASLGQVHRARLRDGRAVAIKVQRPGIPDRIAEDLEAFSTLARFLDAHSELAEHYELEKLVEDFGATLGTEIDYRREAGHLTTIGENLREFDHILVPRPIPDYSTARVLTMDYVQGRKVTALSPLARLEIDGESLAEELFRAYLKQILIDGFFHADPHPGNVFITDDGRLALIDLGMVARLPESLQEGLMKLLVSVAEGRGEEAADRAALLGRKQDGYDPTEFTRRIARLVTRYQHATVEELQIGRVIFEISRASAETRLRLPQELVMLGKTLLNLDQVGRTLAPDFDPNASVRRNTADLLSRRMWKSTSPGSVAAALLDAREIAQKLPARVSRLLDLAASNQLRLRVDAIDEQMLIEGLHKIANRVALGLILAALIVGSALFLRVPTSFRVLGYPGLAAICFLGAVGGGIALIVSILANDRKKPRHGQRR